MSKTYTIEGVLHRISPKRQVAGGKKLRNFVLRWPVKDGWHVAQLLFTGDNVVTLDSYHPGQLVAAEFTVEGREWTNPKTGDTKIFTDLVCWKLTRIGSYT
jgi:hypothetical protein